MKGIVLVRGASRRLGNGKPFKPLCGRRLIDWVLLSLSSVADEIYLVATEDVLDRVRDLGHPVIVDKGNGPAEALRSAALGLDGRFFVCGSDMPLLEPDAISELFRHEGEIVIPRWRNGYLEPLHAVYEMGAVRRTRSRSLHGMAAEVRANFVSAEKIGKRYGFHTFFNVNTEGDLMRAEELIRSLRSPGC